MVARGGPEPGFPLSQPRALALGSCILEVTTHSKLQPSLWPSLPQPKWSPASWHPAQGRSHPHNLPGAREAGHSARARTSSRACSPGPPPPSPWGATSEIFPPLPVGGETQDPSSWPDSLLPLPSQVWCNLSSHFHSVNAS